MYTMPLCYIDPLLPFPMALLYLPVCLLFPQEGNLGVLQWVEKHILSGII